MKRDLSSRINNLEQRTRINNVEIVGLPKPTLMESDTSVTVGFLNDHVDLDLSADEIEALHEVPSKRKDGKRLVIVHFKSRYRRDNILSACKEKLRNFNKNLEEPKRVYVNEHLSPTNKMLFALATKKKHELSYKFVWSKNGTVFMRKDTNTETIRITSVEDIEQVM